MSGVNVTNTWGNLLFYIIIAVHYCKSRSTRGVQEEEEHGTNYFRERIVIYWSMKMNIITTYSDLRSKVHLPSYNYNLYMIKWEQCCQEDLVNS